MARTITHNKRAVRATNIVLCLLFMLFSFVYLYAFQGEMMRMVQHLLSHGRTQYQVFLFAVLITLGLTLLGLVLLRVVPFPGRFKALAWIPSFAVLGWLTDVSLSVAEPSPHSISAWPFVLLAFIYFSVSYVLLRIQEPIDVNATFHEMAWPNFFVFMLGMAFTGWVGNTNRTLHYELRMERLCIDEEYGKLLMIGAEDDNSSRRIMALRFFALSKLDALGDQLFHFSNNLGSDYILPAPIDSLRPANMPQRLRSYLGGFPVQDMNATRFLQHLASDTLAKEPVRDYLLCALLLDKNVDTFVDSLVSYYAPKPAPEELAEDQRKSNKKKNKKNEPILLSSLPRHYAEALALYGHLTQQPKALLDNTAINSEFDKYVGQMELPDSLANDQILEDTFGDTYWWYYYHDNDK